MFQNDNTNMHLNNVFAVAVLVVVVIVEKNIILFSNQLDAISQQIHSQLRKYKIKSNHRQIIKGICCKITTKVYRTKCLN